jgi:hypothetical protein
MVEISRRVVKNTGDKKMKQTGISSTLRKWRHGKALAGVAAGILVTAIVMIMAGQSTANAADVVVYKSPTCGCCTAWVEHLEENGLSVEVHNRRDMNPVKDMVSVPTRLRSCHTAVAGDYVIEGHVPADLISKALREKPKVKGLAVPGMPMGSPGMEGPRKDDYAVLTFTGDGQTSVYAER